MFGGRIIIEHPKVTLLPGSNMARVEGRTVQAIEETITYNEYGQKVKRVDAEGNVTIYWYHPENGGGLTGNIIVYVGDAQPTRVHDQVFFVRPVVIPNDELQEYLRGLESRGIEYEVIKELPENKILAQCARAAEAFPLSRLLPIAESI